MDTLTTRTNRLDRLPFTKKHRRLLAGTGVGWALDAMDVGLISCVIAQLAVEWQLTQTETSWIASAGFVGMAIGASLGGLLADRIGRRQVFAITLLIFGLATGASALAGSLAVLIVLRIIVGLGLGAELPVASTYMSEFAPPRIRGRVIVLLEAFWAVGWTASALIGFFVVPVENGWRWAFLIGALPAIYAALVRFGMPESVRFLESRGRHAEAEAVVQAFEASAKPSQVTEGKFPTDTASESPDIPAGTVTEPAQDVAEPAALSSRQRLVALWAPGQRKQTAPLWIVWFCVNFSYYGAFIWIPTILVAAGFPLVRSFGFTLIITLAQLPGYFVAAWLIEALGRGRTLAIFLTGSAIAAFLFGTATGEVEIISYGMLLSFFNLGAWGALYAVTPELYPTWLRGTGTGWAAGVGRIASIIAPLAVPVLLAVGGTPLLFAVFGAFFIVAAVTSLFFAEKRGLALSE
ncbi:MAG: MFS transporter [Microbacteriaceae bacterium]